MRGEALNRSKWVEKYILSALRLRHNVMCMFFAQGVCVFVFWLLVKEAV